MKRVSAVCLLALSAALAWSQAGKTLTVAEFVHPPFAYLDAQTNEPKGADIGFFQAVLKDLGYQAKFVFVPLPRMLEMVKSGEADIGPILAKNPEREEFALFSAESLLTMVPVLIVRADSPLKQLKAATDLAGFKIGASTGATIPPFFANAGLPPFDMATGEDMTTQNLKKLIGMRFDAVLEVNPLNAALAVKAMNIGGSVRMLDVPGTSTLFYVMVSKKSALAADVLAGINAGIKAKKYLFNPYLQAELK
jgi:ABC-type amino acid transport substrate-binding protein